MEAGMTQEQVALEAKINKSEVSLLEQGLRNPKWETMKRLAKGLGVPCWHMVALGEQLEADESEDEDTRPPPG